jgi:hypothetical protein
MTSVIPLQILTEQFYRKQLKMNLNGFFIKYNKKIHLVTVHHNLPIKTVMYENNKLEININSCWNELLILEPNFYDNYLVNTKWVHILKNDDIINITNNNYKINFSNISYEFIEYDNLYASSRIPYITATLDIDESIEKINLSGLSGSPVYKNNKLAGIFSRYNIIEKKAYIIPIYLVIKTLMKKDNDVLNIPNKILKKIDYYNIKKGYIFYKPFNINIPLDTYYLLENDNSQKCILNDDSIIEYNNTHDIIINKSNLIKKDDKYKVSYRLLTLLKKIISDKSILVKLLDLYTENNEIYVNNDLNYFYE